MAIFDLRYCAVYTPDKARYRSNYEIENGDLIIHTPTGKAYRVVGSHADAGFVSYHAVRDGVTPGLHIVHEFWR